MASRRKLKKTIQFVSSELINEVYFRCLTLKEVEESKIDSIVEEISNVAQEFILRTNTPDGKENPKISKAYFRKLYADWQKSIQKIIEDIDKI